MQSDKYRVIRAEEPEFPAFYRVVWTSHVAELSDLSRSDRILCMEVVNVVEQVLRSQLQPSKVNLASLGNVVPHLHWHVIARFDWDTHYPAPVWAQPLRASNLSSLHELRGKLASLEQVMVARFMQASCAVGRVKGSA